MELRDYLDVLRRRWPTMLVVALAVFALSALFTVVSTPTYTATTRLFFGVEGTGSAAELAQGSTFAERQMTSYVEVATSPIVLDPVIQQLGLDVAPAVLATEIKATVPTDTVILEVSVTDVDAERSAAIANAIGSTLAGVAAGLSPDRADGSQAVRATTLAPASIPTDPSSPAVLRNLALGLAIGLLLGTATALLRNLLDTKVRSEIDVRSVTPASILGVIAFDDALPEHPVILREDPRSAAAEAVRRLRTNLQFVDVAERSRSIVVSSSLPGEGKSTTAINLAVSLADAGARVLLIDADLRRPSVADYLGLEGGAGLTTVLIGRADVQDVVQPWGDTTLDVLPAGQIPPNPSELLGSTAMRTLLDRLNEMYDMVLIDSPPLLPVTDAAVLGRQVGGVLLVAGVDRIHRPQLKETLESLDTAGCHLLGLVVNKIARRDVGAYVYERGYYSAESTQAPETDDEVSTATGTSLGADPDEPTVEVLSPAASSNGRRH